MKARELPVLTISSGPTNSMRGAAFLSGEQDAVVIDVGGTTTDVGVIKFGFPREASGYSKVLHCVPLKVCNSVFLILYMVVFYNNFMYSLYYCSLVARCRCTHQISSSKCD